MTKEEAIEVYKELINPRIKEAFETFVPELAESEDEKTKKEIVTYLKSVIANKGYRDKIIESWIAWLEKQGKSNPYSSVSFEYNGNIWGMCARDNGVDILCDKHIIGHLDKQGEQNKQIFWEKCNHCEYFDGYDICLHKKNFGSVTNESKENCENNKFYFEKQQKEQKFADKVEPKFHEGDWVVTEDNRVVQIKEFEKYEKICYFADRTSISMEDLNSCRLWTINDAKDGDVLAYENDIVIFKENNYNPEDKSGCMFVHCSCNNFYEIGGINPTDYKPATKEQCSLLFSKMKEAGYDWDADKRELRKIEQKPVEWKQENVEDLTDFENAMMHIGNSFFGDNAGLDPNDTNAIKEQANLLLELVPKQEWSEEDKKMIDEMYEFFDKHKVPSLKHNMNDYAEFIKSLKDRYTWKPSDGQMVVLNDIIINGHLSNANERILKGLQEQLKKLRKE